MKTEKRAKSMGRNCLLALILYIYSVATSFLASNEFKLALADDNDTLIIRKGKKRGTTSSLISPRRGLDFLCAKVSMKQSTISLSK